MDPITGGQPQQAQPVQQPAPTPIPTPPPQAPTDASAPVAQQPQQAQPAQPMPQLNDQFLQEVGLGVLPEVERTGMLQQMRKTLETNVGMEIYKNLADYQLQEFEGFMPLTDENGQVLVTEETATANARRWLDGNIPGWQSNPALKPYLNEPARVRDWAAMNWLQRNFPRYRDVVSAELNKLMGEVRNNVPQIIEAVMGPQAQAQPLQASQSAQPLGVPQQPPVTTSPEVQPPVQPAPQPQPMQAPVDQQPPVTPVV